MVLEIAQIDIKPGLEAEFEASVALNPTFAGVLSLLLSELPNQSDTSNIMILVSL
jgi:hypothetical protein